ncbi:MAG: hypothetical protein J6U51_03205 [Bacteroidales bacterium]|nr:hypothetical protein [Bacteroidales bacterium]
MKAILKSNRKVIVDVEPLVKWLYLNERKTECSYSDKDGNIYYDYELEFIEYYGG